MHIYIYNLIIIEKINIIKIFNLKDNNYNNIIVISNEFIMFNYIIIFILFD